MNEADDSLRVRADAIHIPVLAGLVRDVFSIPPTTVLDATAGAGGHTSILMELGHRVVALDRDARAIERLTAKFSHEIAAGQLTLHHASFDRAAEFGAFGGALTDLGLSSDQLADASRGFSFNADGALDMRMDVTLSRNAADLVEQASEEELASILWEYGEEKESRRIACAVAGRRFASANEFAHAVRAAKRMKGRRIDPATQTFQALRIAVNDELGQLARFLDSVPHMLLPDARLGIISFHSLEDRFVKVRFEEWFGKCVCPPRMPVCGCGSNPSAYPLWNGSKKADSEECETNPRARSARMRALRVMQRMPQS